MGKKANSLVVAIAAFSLLNGCSMSYTLGGIFPPVFSGIDDLMRYEPVKSQRWIDAKRGTKGKMEFFDTDKDGIPDFVALYRECSTRERYTLFGVVDLYRKTMSLYKPKSIESNKPIEYRVIDITGPEDAIKNAPNCPYDNAA